MATLLLLAGACGVHAFDAPTYRGKGDSLVDKTIASDTQIALKLDPDEQDLAGDGWRVLRHDVERGRIACGEPGADFTLWAQRNAPRVREIRSIVQADYSAAPDEVKLVFIIGHVPVPYSGTGDAWTVGNHYSGALPADGFYADPISAYGVLGWSDLNTVSADQVSIETGVHYPGVPPCYNNPGDGKFDQDAVPTPAPLGIGRVDLSLEPEFHVNEATLLSRYLDKDHDFRTGVFSVKRRMISVCWSPAEVHFCAAPGSELAFGSDVLHISDQSMHWFPNVSAQGQDYLVGYGGGYGGGGSAFGIGTTGNWGTPDGDGVNSSKNNFVDYDSRVVFVSFFGSFFGNWEEWKDLLKAPLANPYDPPMAGMVTAWLHAGLVVRAAISLELLKHWDRPLVRHSSPSSQSMFIRL
ncbi:MAG: hypothetical protein U1F98_14220 [Verrucomicrobiota bacterium]